jgi:protein-tyrosine phosphatase
MKTDICWIRDLPSGRLGIAPRPRGGDWLDDEIKAWRLSGVDCVVSALTPAEEVELELVEEQAACQKNGLRFVSLPIADRGVPSSPSAFQETVAELTENLNAGQTVLVHCRQGIGRASLIAASVLAETGEGPDSAFARIQRSRARPVPDTEEQRNWVRRFAASARSAQPTRRVHRRLAVPKAHA